MNNHIVSIDNILVCVLNKTVFKKYTYYLTQVQYLEKPLCELSHFEFFVTMQ